MANDDMYNVATGKSVEQLVNRMTKALETVSKELGAIAKGTSDRTKETAGEKDESTSIGAVAGQASVTGATMGGGPIAGAIVTAIEKIGASIVETVVNQAEKAHKSLVDATLTQPQNEVRSIVEQRARVGVSTSQEEMDTLMSQLSDPHQRAARASLEADVNFAGSGVLGTMSEELFDTNIQKDLTELGNWGGNLTHKIETMNRDNHNELAKRNMRIITADGALEGE